MTRWTPEFSVDLTCADCETTFRVRKNRAGRCEPCRNARRKAQRVAWVKANREQINARAKELGHGRRATLRQYGLTEESFTALLIAQDGRCGICNEPMPEPCVDHEHYSGTVRGLLCRSCNVAIGLLGDTADGVRRALDYLTKGTS